MSNSSQSINTYRIAHQFPVGGNSSEKIGKFCKWWMGVNHQTSAIAHNPTTNEIRIAMLIDAASPEDALREAGNQFSLLKEDFGDDAPEVPAAVPEWPAWAEQMIQPILYHREHGVAPPGYRETQEGPPNLTAG